MRCGTAAGVTTHNLRAETSRDLAAWARALVNGSHIAVVAQQELVCRCTWKGRAAQLVIHYDSGFTLYEGGTTSSGQQRCKGGPRSLWHFPFDRLRASSDDGNRLLWLDFAMDEGDIVRKH